MKQLLENYIKKYETLEKKDALCKVGRDTGACASVFFAVTGFNPICVGTSVATTIGCFFGDRYYESKVKKHEAMAQKISYRLQGDK